MASVPDSIRKHPKHQLSPDGGMPAQRGVTASADGKWDTREVVHARQPFTVLEPLDLDGERLNLGAGWDPTEGYLRLDRAAAGNPDVVAEVPPIPLEDGRFVEVRAFHVLEHVPREKLVELMNECWRVLQMGGYMEIEVPVFPSDAAMADPTHISFFVPATFDYFIRGGQFDGERRLYGLRPWELTDRVRDPMKTFLRVRLRKVAEEPLEAAAPAANGDQPVAIANVSAGMQPDGFHAISTAEPLARFFACCGSPRNRGHLTSCPELRA